MKGKNKTREKDNKTTENEGGREKEREETKRNKWIWNYVWNNKQQEKMKRETVEKETDSYLFIHWSNSSKVKIGMEKSWNREVCTVQERFIHIYTHARMHSTYKNDDDTNENNKNQCSHTKNRNKKKQMNLKKEIKTRVLFRLPNDLGKRNWKNTRKKSHTHGKDEEEEEEEGTRTGSYVHKFVRPCAYPRTSSSSSSAK